MKRVAVVLVVVIMLISLCSCVKYYHFNYEDLINNVQTIEIIEYDANTNQEQLLAVISDENKEQFLLSLSQLEYHYRFGDPISPEGLCIKLTYNNSECEIINHAGSTNNGFIKCDKTLFEEMLQKYLPK